MNTIKSFSTNRPVLFVLILTIVWFMLGLVLTGVSSAVLQKPYGDATVTILGRGALTICILLLIWKLGWLDVSGITRLGSGRVWLVALGGLIYFTYASLYAFYGNASFDFSILARLPESRVTILMHFVVALSEEILFRGIVLYVLARAWGNTPQGLIGSVVFSSFLFAIMHATQIFTDRLEPSSALILVLETFIIAIWWGALVVAGGSIWQAVTLHFAGNATVVVQGLSTPMLVPELLVYKHFLWFSLVLGLIGIGLLAQIILKDKVKTTEVQERI